MKKYNISKPEKYTKDGQEKTVWHQCGTMTEFPKQDGSISRIIEIPAIGLKANVFEQQPKEQSAKQNQWPDEAHQAVAKQKVDAVEYPEESINPEDIPF